MIICIRIKQIKATKLYITENCSSLSITLNPLSVVRNNITNNHNVVSVITIFLFFLHNIKKRIIKKGIIIIIPCEKIISNVKIMLIKKPSTNILYLSSNLFFT